MSLLQKTQEQLIKEQRDVTKICIDITKIENEINILFTKIKNLYIILKKYKLIQINNVYELFETWRKQDSAGQVHKDDIREVIEKGNIREKMTLLMNFCEGQCDLLWIFMINYDKLKIKLGKNIRKQTGITNIEIKYRINRIENLTGVPWNFIKTLKINDIYTIMKKGPYPSNCNLFFKPDKTGPVSLSRNNFNPIMRQPSNKENCCDTTDKTENCDKEYHNILIKDIYPELSSREKRYIGEDYIKKNKWMPCWNTGYKYWDINTDEENILYKYAKEKNFLLIAGPSANTDMKLNLGKFFGCNLELIYMSCICWMGNGPDHSIFEMALATIPFPLKIPYKVGDDPYKWTNTLINKYS